MVSSVILSRLSFEPWKSPPVFDHHHRSGPRSDQAGYAAEADGSGRARFVENCYARSRLLWKKKASDSTGKMAAARAFDCLAEVLRENLSFHAAAWPRRPFGLSNRQDRIRVRGRRGGFRTPPKAYSILNKIVPDECGRNVIGK
jgi:hypothetical protein